MRPFTVHVSPIFFFIDPSIVNSVFFFYAKHFWGPKYDGAFGTIFLVHFVFTFTKDTLKKTEVRCHNTNASSEWTKGGWSTQIINFKSFDLWPKQI